VLALLAAAVVALPTVIAASNGLLDVVYNIKPEWRPDGPPAAIGATLNAVELEERLVEDESGVISNLISFDIELVGYRGNQIELEWAAFDARTHQRVSLFPPGVVADKNVPVGRAYPVAPNDRLNESFPIPIPARGSCVFVRVYVFDYAEDDTDDARRTRQDYLDSAPFDTRNPENRACLEAPAPPATGGTNEATPDAVQADGA
jgi:hypothetical protein